MNNCIIMGKMIKAGEILIYTKNGDSGYSTNIKNQKYQKDYILFDLLGSIDELSANLGLAKLESSKTVADTITALQIEFFNLSTYISGGKKFDTNSAVSRLELLIDSFSKKFEMPKKFTISGKTKAGAFLDVARTVARRTERISVKANKIFIINKDDISYFNRLSDLLYILARYSDSLQNEETASVYETKTTSLNFDLKQADILCEKVMKKARQMGVLVVCAVCDSGGNLMSLSRDDNAYIASINVAQNKAYTAVSLKMKTEALADLTKPGNSLYGIQHQDDRLVIFGGGIPLVKDGNIVGGFGVSGGTLEQDIYLADYCETIFREGN